MKTIGKIFRQDLKSITKNLIIFAVVIGITILPALYAWFNIAANWDPYSNTGDLPFAVCSLDKGYTYDGLEINAGDKIVENVKSNTQMGWVTDLSEEEVTRGVDDGKYFAGIVIPENFTENLLSIATGKFSQAKFDYYVNEKSNAIAPKITDAGKNALQNTIDQIYVSTIAEMIATTLNITEKELEGDKTKLADKLKTALSNAKVDINSANETIDLLIATLDSIDKLIKANQDMLPQIQSTINKAGVVAGDIKTVVNNTRNATAQLTGTVEELISSGDEQMQSISSELDSIFSDASADANTVADKLNKVKTINEAKIAVNNKLIAVLEKIQSGFGIDCSKVINHIKANNDKQQAIIDKINNICDNIKKTGSVPQDAKSVLDGLVNDAKDELAAAKTEFSSIKSQADDAISDSFDSIDKIADFASSIDIQDGNLNSAFTAGSDTITNLKKVLNELKDVFTKLNDKIDKTINRVSTLENDDTLENMLLPIIEDPKALGEFISAPVTSETHSTYPIKNYGSAMTPFYSSLALWVGGVVLVAVLNVDLTPRDRKKLGKANSVQLFFGRYIIFFIAGQLQALIIALGDLFFLKVQCENYGLFIVGCLISSFVYTLFIYSLTITFSVVGKALAVIVLILQVAGSGGTFPIEVLPGPYKALAPFLPFKYGIDALRETVGGVNFENYWRNIGILLLFTVPALLLGLLLRKPCIKPIGFFNKKIEESDLVI